MRRHLWRESYGSPAEGAAARLPAGIKRPLRHPVRIWLCLASIGRPWRSEIEPGPGSTEVGSFHELHCPQLVTAALHETPMVTTARRMCNTCAVFRAAAGSACAKPTYQSLNDRSKATGLGRPPTGLGRVGEFAGQSSRHSSDRPCGIAQAASAYVSSSSHTGHSWRERPCAAMTGMRPRP